LHLCFFWSRPHCAPVIGTITFLVNAHGAGVRFESRNELQRLPRFDLLSGFAIRLHCLPMILNSYLVRSCPRRRRTCAAYWSERLGEIILRGDFEGFAQGPVALQGEQEIRGDVGVLRGPENLVLVFAKRLDPRTDV